MVRVKIWCISSVEEAALVKFAMAPRRSGLVGRMPIGPEVIVDRLIAEFTASTPPPVDHLSVTSETYPEAIVDHVRRCGIIIRFRSSTPLSPRPTGKCIGPRRG